LKLGFPAALSADAAFGGRDLKDDSQPSRILR